MRKRSGRVRAIVEAVERRMLLSVAYQVTDLGSLGGNYTDVSAINDAGQITGNSKDAAGQLHSYVWQNEKMRELAGAAPGFGSIGMATATTLHFPGSSSTTVAATNSKGDSAGYYGPPYSERAFLYKGGHYIDLGQMPPPEGSENTEAEALNNSDVVVGIGICRV